MHAEQVPLDYYRGTDSALGEPHATSYVKDSLNRAMLVVDGLVGIGKGVLFKRLGHMLTEGKMAIRLLYHDTGLAVPCVDVKLTASDHLWHRVHEKLSGVALTLNETVIRIALSKMKKLL